MRITNKTNLPQALVDAVSNDSYESGGSDITVTQLIQPARKVALERAHADELEEDASDRIWLLIGQIGHLILERAASSQLAEKRLFTEWLGWKVSGKADMILPDTICDYKLTSAWSIKEGARKEYHEQLNLLAQLATMNGIAINKLQIVAILRDWSKLEAIRNADYPRHQVAVFDIPLWTETDRLAFLDRRVQEHQEARKVLPFCTPEEMWERPAKFAVMKKGNKRAVKLCDGLHAARALADTNESYYIQNRPSERPRCEHYCAAAPFCSSHQQWKAARLADAEAQAQDENMPSLREG